MYFKMLITMIIALFSTRLVLEALGASDYGLFTLVAGIIGALSFLNKSMSTVTQRYLSRTKKLGHEALNRVFNTSMILHFIIAFIFVILLEAVGFFLFNGILTIAPERISVAKLIFHCMVTSSFLSIITVPYDALINTHEQMFIFALFSILESLFKLGIAIFLFFSPVDRLATYGILLTFSLLLLRSIRRIYSRLHYPESKISFHVVDKKLMKEMIGFSGWNLLESVTYIAKGQGMPILLNIFFGTLINAAYGISMTVRQNVTFFSSMIFKTSNPQIMSNIGVGELNHAIKQTITVCKFSFLLFSIFSIPLIVEMPFVLSIWLKNVPDYTIIFCRLTLITSLIIMLTRGLNFLIMGIGKIKYYEISLSLLNLIVFPISFIVLKMGYSPISVFIGILISDILVVVVRIFFASKYSKMSKIFFCKEIICKIIPLVLMIFAVLTSPVLRFFDNNVINFITTFVFSTLFLSFGFWFFILNQKEQNTLIKFFNAALQKVGLHQKH